MNGIETIHLLWNLLAVWLPGAAVGAMIVCTVLLIRRDRYCRKLALAESPEAAGNPRACRVRRRHAGGGRKTAGRLQCAPGRP